MPIRSQTANDLSIDIFTANKAIDWQEALSDLLEIFESSSKENTENPLVSIIRNEKENYNSQDIRRLYSQMDIITSLNNILNQNDTAAAQILAIRDKYNIQSILKECINMRANFNNERSDYLVNRIFNLQDFPTSSLFRYTESPAAIVAEMIDELLLRVAPEAVTIYFEEMNGKERFILCRNKTLIEGPDGQLDSCPAPKMFGKSIFDSFLISYYYDTIHKEWVGIPVDLIQRIKYSGFKDLGEYNALAETEAEKGEEDHDEN